MRKRFLLLHVCLLLPTCCSAQSRQPGVMRFEDIGKQAGLAISHISSPDKRYILESMSGGIGFLDCDKDQKLDIVTVNGSTVDRYRSSGGDLLVTLYHQDSNLKFSDITQQAGLARKGWGMGIAVADYDNDGLADLYVTGYNGNALYRGLGNCKFEDVTEKAGVLGGGFSTGAAWADYDRDGYVDLFVARYVHVEMDKLPAFGGDAKFCRYRGLLVQCGPWGMQGESDFLFHNRGNGTFEEVSKKAGMDDPNRYYGLGVVWGDFNNDGWPDLYVANDAGPNFIYRNQHDGTFAEDGLASGAAVSGDGQEQGSMGVDWGDFDHDGRLDIAVTNFVDQSDTLYRNLGVRGFLDVTASSRIAAPTRPYVGWGTALFDADNSGWLDFLAVNGHVYPQVDSIAGEAHFRQPIMFFRNKHNGTYQDVSAESGLREMPLASRRGAAFGDVNNDGCIDVAVLNVGEPPSLLINHCSNVHHRVLFNLIGTESNRLAIGARVTVKSQNLTQFQEVRAGGSYLSQNDMRLHFGLGSDTTLKQVEINWPRGKTERLQNLAPDFIYTVKEGEGIRGKQPLPPLQKMGAQP